MLLLLSLRNMLSSFQVLGPSEAPERGNLGGAMTLPLLNGFFMGEICPSETGTAMPTPRPRWSLPQGTPAEFQPLPHRDCFIKGCEERERRVTIIAGKRDGENTGIEKKQ